MKVWHEMDLVELAQEYLRLQEAALAADILADDCCGALLDRLEKGHLLGVQLEGVKLIRTEEGFLERQLL